MKTYIPLDIPEYHFMKQAHDTENHCRQEYQQISNQPELTFDQKQEAFHKLAEAFRNSQITHRAYLKAAELK